MTTVLLDLDSVPNVKALEKYGPCQTVVKDNVLHVIYKDNNQRLLTEKHNYKILGHGPNIYQKVVDKANNVDINKIIPKIKQRNSLNVKNLKGTASIDEILRENLVDRDSNGLILDGDSECLYTSDYINICEGILECDQKYEDKLCDNYEKYAAELFEGIPCSSELEEKIKSYGDRIEQLNEMRTKLIEDIDSDLSPSIWEEANQFMTLQVNSK